MNLRSLLVLAGLFFTPLFQAYNLEPYYYYETQEECLKRLKVFNDAQVFKFLDRYSCSEDIENKIVETRLNEDWKSFYLKGQRIDRLINAIRLKRFLESHNLDKIGVAEKCWSKKFQQVVSIGVPSVHIDKPISLSELQQLVKVAERAGFLDWHRLNVLRDNLGRHVFIDTEDSSFFKRRGVILSVEHMLRGCKRNYLDTFDLEPEAAEWLEQKLLEVTGSDKKPNSLASNSEYDDADINFEEIKDRLEQIDDQLDQLKGWNSYIKAQSFDSTQEKKAGGC